MERTPWTNYLIVGLLAVLATSWRVYNAETFLAPGLELVTVLAVASALLLPRWQAYAAPLVVFFIGDLILGSAGVSSLFVWLAWAIIAATTLLSRRLHSTKSLIIGGAALGAGSSTIFFLVSNLGVWVHGLSGGWSMPGWEGLLATYVMGLPFYLTPLAANVVLVPVAALTLDAYAQRSSALERAYA